MTNKNQLSIFEYIDSNLQKNGTLPKDFNLDDYIISDEAKNFEPGALDGITYFHAKMAPDQKAIRKLKEILKGLEISDVKDAYNKIEDFFNKNPMIRTLNNIDPILKYISTHKEEINVNALFKLAATLLLLSKNVETVKFAISIFSMINIEHDADIIEIIEKLAVYDEFTLYCTYVIKKLKNNNDIIFSLAKKVDGWGKIYLVSNLKAQNNEIKEWMITDGCYNTVSNSYLALYIAKSVNLEDVLLWNDLTVEEFVGINEIMDGLINEDDFKGISFFKRYNIIFMRYLAIFEKMANVMYFYDIPIKIYTYLKDKNEMNDLITKKKIIDIFESRKTFLILKEAINGGFKEDFKLAIEVLNFDSRIDLAKDVFIKFQENPMEYNFCIEYLFQNPNYKNMAIEILRDSVDLKKHYKDPKPIINTDDEYSNNLASILQIIKYYPFELEDFVIAGLKSETMYPRIAAINAIMEWLMLTKINIKEINPKLLKAIEELQQKEVIKNYKEKLDKILNIKEDLSNFAEPKITKVVNKSKIDLLIDDDDIDKLFNRQTKFRGRDYYENNMVMACIKEKNQYIGYVQGSKFSHEYKVTFNFRNSDIIESMNCDCKVQGYCKHEYAFLLYLRDKFDRDDL